MREIRLSGSEGGGAEMNRLFLPLSQRNQRPAHSGGLSGRLEAGEDACTTRLWCRPLACSYVQSRQTGQEACLYLSMSN